LTNTSFGPGASSSISSTLHGAFTSHNTAAFVFTISPFDTELLAGLPTLTLAREGPFEYCWQVMEPTTTAQISEIAQDTDSVKQTVHQDVTELLVEEISIDGMCGVY
jgi:mycofactocin precursor